jgi:hypothetical protein
LAGENKNRRFSALAEEPEEKLATRFPDPILMVIQGQSSLLCRIHNYAKIRKRTSSAGRVSRLAEGKEQILNIGMRLGARNGKDEE